MCDLRDVLTKKFPNRPGVPNHYGQRICWHDDAQGVQWGCYIDGPELRAKRVNLIVNFEGIKYRDWPITTFINRERDNPTLHNLLGTLPSVDGIDLIWMRDSWVNRRYREADDDYLADTPTPLSLLTREVWLKGLSEARNCLSPDKNGRGRGTRIVPRPSGRRSETSPHLQFRLLLPLPPESRGLNSRERDEAVLHLKRPAIGAAMLREGFKKLQPLYDFVAERSAA